MKYVVQQGDTLLSIALATGLGDWKRIYDAPENAAFKQKCESAERDPNILFPGEELIVPNRELKQAPAAIDARHVYRIPAPPRTKLRVVLERGDGSLMTGQAWELVVGSTTYDGTTGDDGTIEVDVAVEARTGTLTVGDRSYEVHIGYLNPLDAAVGDEGISGAQARLANMGYAIPAIDGQLNDETKAALREFQAVAGITETGELDDDTRKALALAYRS